MQTFHELNTSLDNCCQTSPQTASERQTDGLHDRRQLCSCRICPHDRGRSKSKDPVQKKNICTSCIWIKDVQSSTDKILHLRKRILSNLYAFMEFGHLLWGSQLPVIVLTDNKSVTRFFQTKIIPPALWNACDYVLQYNFVIAHIPGSTNTAADYLSRVELNATEKLEFAIRDDIQVTPIEVNIQSTESMKKRHYISKPKTPD